MVSFLLRDPQACAPEEILYYLCERREGSFQHRRANDENDIPARHNVCRGQSRRLARTPFGPITLMRLPEMLADHETVARASGSISCDVDNKQWMRPRFALTAYSPKLLWTAEPLVTPHRQSPSPA